MKKKSLQKISRKVDRALSRFFDPLAEKVGGAVNLVLIIMLIILSMFTFITIFFGDHNTIFGSVTILVIMVLASKILTRNKFRTRNPWWYREK
ncbi:hypothetical protein SJZ84_21770 [Hafnia paralvei]|uniref:Uncharacterized protein n=1 Tax=Hafnia paralvei TaxID=546367 RepID=A0A2A2M6H0_9GAMM|nr:hypothetical protein [Hafnia paralvei]MDX6913429.1 hypothetical protein [Hafnia paralvei]PAV94058.1 hypothetical protein CJD50_22530 [Hafnia paralvei]